MLRIQKGEGDGAAADLAQAVALDPLNANYRFVLGATMSSAPFPILLAIAADAEVDLAAGDARLVGSKPELVEARSHLGLATELAPENDFYKKCFARYVELLESQLKEEE
jgi:hypothetical protein